MSDGVPDPSSLPRPGSVVVHIGMPKTGTTAIQHIASRRRDQLLAHGVCYPGDRINHRVAANALMARSTVTQPPPSMDHWTAIREEMDDHPDKIRWLSYEQFVQADDEVAERVVGALGGPVTVVITARAVEQMVISAWQQWVKEGDSTTLDDWVAGVVGGAPTDPSASRFLRRHDTGALARRWGSLVGPQNTWLVLPDPGRRAALFEAFSLLLSLPKDVLEPGPLSGAAINRGLVHDEIELVRWFNELARAELDPSAARSASRLMQRGAIAQLQRHRDPGASFPPEIDGRWASRIASMGAAAAEEVRGSGINVVGNLDVLSAVSRGSKRRGRRRHTDERGFDREMVAHVVLGLVRQARLDQERSERG